jgi:hypothetical protein
MEQPDARDPELSRLLSQLYRPGAQIGSGSTAAAVRHEQATGTQVGGREHDQKARDNIVALQRRLRNNPTAQPGDRAAAENVIRDMQNALAGRTFEDLANASSILADRRADWAPGAPPATVAMVDLGQEIVDAIDRVRDEELERVSVAVEAALGDGPKNVQDAVATGFLEAAINATDRNPGGIRFLRALGPLAKADPRAKGQRRERADQRILAILFPKNPSQSSKGRAAPARVVESSWASNQRPCFSHWSSGTVIMATGASGLVHLGHGRGWRSVLRGTAEGGRPPGAMSAHIAANTSFVTNAPPHSVQRANSNAPTCIVESATPHDGQLMELSR